jgi:Glycine zipper 2TM domain
MRKIFPTTALALAAFVPSIATAATCDSHRSGRIAATVGGGAVGAVAGGAIAGRGDRTEGAIIGGVIGAIAGNQIAKPSHDCSRAYGWYDKDGRWHATRVRSTDARGYYDRNGDWVEGRPTGYYEGSRWVSYEGDAEGHGYTDASGYWVPTNAYGYYDTDGRWVSGSASGYYDERGRWVAGAARGYYDARGRWIAGEPPYGNASSWSSVEQSGYYDRDGRWVAGRTYGYYDSRGRWIPTRRSNDTTSDDWANQPDNLSERISWMRERIERLENRDRLTRSEERYALNELSAIERQHRIFVRSGGRFTGREQANIRMRLNRLSSRINVARREARAY